jgi:tetratricopeptide (TPR) repeat protein
LFKNILLAFLLLFSPLFGAKHTETDEVDYIALASILIRDGHNDRALSTLQEVNLDNNETDLVRFYTLRGIVKMKLQDYRGAITDFEDSFRNGNTEEQIRIYLSKAYYTVKNYEKTISTLDLVPHLLYTDKSLIGMKAQSYWLLDKKDEALETIKDGLRKFPDFANLHKQKFFYLVELGLFQSAKESGLKYLSMNEKVEPADYLRIGNAFRKSGEFLDALRFLQLAQLKYPNNAEILIEMGQTYIDKGELLSAGHVFERASLLDNKYSQEASELFRRVKDFYHTLYLNAKIVDQKEKFKQRLALYLELGQFENAVAMEKGMSRIGILEDDNIRYALAFALSQVGKYERAERHLKYITNSELFKKATQLRASMVDCQKDMWSCQD